MKKFLSICFCLMLCLTSILFIGCEEKPVSIGEAEATQILNTAMGGMYGTEAVKMYSEDFMFMGEFVSITTETITYSSFFGQQSWIKQENGQWWDYSISTYEYNDEEYTDYSKMLVIEEEEDYGDETPLEMILEEFEDAQFSKATKLNGKYEISFAIIDDGVTTTLTFNVENDELKSIVVSAGGISMSLEFTYGASAIAELPEIPTNVDWYVYEPYIEVDGIPTEFVVGETLNLLDATINYYEDADAWFSEIYFVTSDMITGFDTTTATEPGATRTITVTFYGLTFDIEYTVVEAIVE